MRCVAIDDEPIALAIIRRYCQQRGDVTLETYSSPHAGMKRVREWLPDIVFLDIEMNGVSGIELARQLPKGCCLIFTTAYAQYALDGFDVCAVDFLHKPFFYERFNRAMQKAEQWLRMNDLLRMAEAGARQIVLKSEYKNVTVSMDTILYIESVDNYVKLHLTDGKTILSKISLSSIQDCLPNREFMRIHRSFVVAVRRIEKFTRSAVILSNCGKCIPIGKKYAEEVIIRLHNQDGLH